MRYVVLTTYGIYGDDRRDIFGIVSTFQIITVLGILINLHLFDQAISKRIRSNSCLAWMLFSLLGLYTRVLGMIRYRGPFSYESFFKGSCIGICLDLSFFATVATLYWDLAE
ncbi:uncharacterized protein LOC118435596 [Folsomia candida]|uniref:uncharacterized protein LOC118435596 n=1 Tax=Folsomia candida TaxID=158441 RepID=UPI0016051DA0|nr:uncharacterized protein LOC118435596 [Folsomia candida]